MDRNRREHLVNRLLSGKLFITIDDITYTIKIPTPELIYKANALYDKTLHEIKYYEWISKKDATRILKHYNIWSPENDSNLKVIDTRIEDLKIELYQALTKSDEDKNKIRKTLRMVQEKHTEMLMRKHMFDYMTPEGYAENAKSKFIMSHTVYIDDVLFQGDTFTLQKISRDMDKCRISVEEMRELARTDPWRSIWSCSKERAFETIGDEQRTLILFTKMYDGAHEHPECPDDSVIEDDDMFDGWMLVQRREREKNQRDKTINQSAQFDKRHPGANEIFVPAKSQKHADEIFNYNDVESKVLQRKRAAAIQQLGSVEEKDLPDVKQHLQMEAMNLQSELFKKQKGK